MKKSNVLRTAIACVALCATAWSETLPNSTTADALKQASAYLFQFRAGQYDVAPKFIAVMEEAIKTDPENADLWYNLGFAYLSEAAATMLTGGKPADAIIAIQKGPQALEHALKLNPNHAEALAVHGGMQAMMASFMGAPQMVAKGVAEMNRAVEVSPNSTRARLARAFNGLSLPTASRNNVTEAEDLDFLIELADGSRSGDYIHILRGDLDFELGKTDLAREQYEIVSKSASPAAADAKARLTALTQGGVAAADIKKLRSSAGANCAMCHGK